MMIIGEGHDDDNYGEHDDNDNEVDDDGEGKDYGDDNDNEVDDDGEGKDYGDGNGNEDDSLSYRYYMYYLIHEKECFIIFKTRGAAERFRYDKTRLFECIK